MGGKGSGRKKLCPHCRQVLVCQACDEQFTPETEPKSRVNISFTDRALKKLNRRAKREGKSRSEYVEGLMKKRNG